MEAVAAVPLHTVSVAVECRSGASCQVQASCRRDSGLRATAVLFSKGNVDVSSCSSPWQGQRLQTRRSSAPARASGVRSSHVRSRAALKAVVFDCDGVILESEDLHRQAYNATFDHFGLRCPGEPGPVNWSTEFYDVFQNQVGGGKPKMRWYFNKHGWPHSSEFPSPPTTDEDREKLIDVLQDWKSAKYQQLIGSGSVPTRPGVLELMDEARAKGKLVAVCSAATKSSVIFTLESLLGKERFRRLDCFMAGDDVPTKKPDPTIYKLAAERLGVSPQECVVVEDSIIGLQAATGAGMPCIITYTSSTKVQDFGDAITVFPNLEGVNVGLLEDLLEKATSTAAL